MDRTVSAALARGVAVGAHPSYPDFLGFGLRAMQRPPRNWRRSSWSSSAPWTPWCDGGADGWST